MQKLLVLLLFFSLSHVQAQHPEKLNSAEIYSEIEKLNFLGSALYIAAHPDDENTRLISYLSNELHARTAYLSLTRGDGGQNLIGPQLRELLGVIRTEELVEARKIDGGEQFFTRANDFGYSKTPAETLKIWNEEEVLKDVVRNIRRFKPDIIINRFDANSAGETHGHHTASALLSTRAFDMAGKNDIFQEQIRELGTWQPKKMFFNTSFWFYGSQEAFDAADKSKLLQLDIGVFYPLKGLSNNEIAALSRSRHQSQGFGSTGTRGSTMEYLELIAGEQPPNNNDLFFGINTTWSRLKGGEAIGKLLSEVQKEFDFKNPASSVPKLLQARKLIQNLEDAHWRDIKLSEIDNIIMASSGLYLEAAANTALATPGEEVRLNLEAINRSSLPVELLSVSVVPTGSKMAFSTSLLDNEVLLKEMSFRIPENFSYTSPYWLQEPGSLGMYRVENTENIGLAETPRLLQAQFSLKINDTEINFSKNIIFKFNDPVSGENYRPFEVVPAVSVSSNAGVLLFANSSARRVPVTVKSFKEGVSGQLLSGKTNGWKISPEKHNFGPLKKGEEKTFFFEIQPPKKQGEITFSPTAQIGNKQYRKAVVQLEYAHIPVQTLVMPNETQLLKPQFQKRGDLVGYIQGAGDEVPQALQEMGYRVDILNPEALSAAALSKYDAVVTGIRAYNTVEVLRYKQPVLLDYVKNGGNLILQYNTSHALVTQNLAPYELNLSRDRVTQEDSKVELLAKEHPALNFPNKITEADFEGWIQERGLYFPNDWGSEFTPLLSMHDLGEAALEGSLLVAPYGEGYFVYTGLSFFRELPAGVAGAYRLFANLISLGKEDTPATKSAQ